MRRRNKKKNRPMGQSFISRDVSGDKYKYDDAIDSVKSFSYRDFLRGKAQDAGVKIDSKMSDSQLATGIAKSKMKRLNETYKPQTECGRMMMGGKEGREKFNTLISKINNRINEPTAPDMDRIHSPFTRAAEKMAKSLGVKTNQRKSNAKTVRSMTRKMNKPSKSLNFRKMGSRLLD